MYEDKNKLEKIHREVLMVKEQLGINLSRSTVVSIESAFFDTSYNIKISDIKNSLSFIKLVYIALFGDIEGLDDFINSKRIYGYATYSRMRIRLAIFNHFGFLKEAFTIKPELLISKFFNDISTSDIYKVLSTNKFNSLDEFISYVNRLTFSEKEELRKTQVSGEVFKELDDELMKELKSLSNKNAFLKMMNKSKK